MDITFISDLHGHYPSLPGGDLLIIAGDLTARDTATETDIFYLWLDQQDYKKKIVIAGNHDNYFYHCFKHEVKPFSLPNTEYLCDSGTTFEYEEEVEGEFLTGKALIKRNLKIFGSPWTKSFPRMNPRCKAFTVDTEKELAEKFSLIPLDTDILITHSPPYDFRDHIINEFGDRVPCGSESLYFRVTDIYPKIHCFGHIHEEYGIEHREYFTPSLRKEVTYINASHVNERYEPVNSPIRIEI